MKYKGILGPKVGTMSRALAYFRKVAKDRKNALRISFTPHAPMVKGAEPQEVLPEGSEHSPGLARSPSRVAKGAARVESNCPRAFDASYGPLKKSSSAQKEGQDGRMERPDAAAATQPEAQLPGFNTSTTVDSGEPPRPHLVERTRMTRRVGPYDPLK